MLSKIVYNAFNLTGEGVPIKGGQNNSFRFGDIIVKKNDGDNLNYETTAKILNELYSPHYRVTKPILSRNGRYEEEGFIATRYAEGWHDFDRIEESLALSKIFHKDLSKYSIGLYKQSDNPWAVAMGILFRSSDIPDYDNKDRIKICLEMMESLAPVNDKLQIIHGDLGGNILFHDTLPPCIIDFSPNIAPAKMAEAIIVCDAIAWENKGFGIIGCLGDFEEYKNYLLYAVMFRLLTAAVNKSGTKEQFASEFNAYKKVWDYVLVK